MMKKKLKRNKNNLIQMSFFSQIVVEIKSYYLSKFISSLRQTWKFAVSAFNVYARSKIVETVLSKVF